MSKKGLVLEEIWPELENGITRVINISNENRDFSYDDWMKLYVLVHDFCIKPDRSNHTAIKQNGAHFGGEPLYSKLLHFLQDYLTELTIRAEQHYAKELLLFYRQEWEKYTSAMAKVSHIFTYLNRHWIKRESEDGKKEVYEIYPLSLVIWREIIFKSLKQKLNSALLGLIEKERNGELIDVSLVKSVVRSFVSLGFTKDKPDITFYHKVFGGEFVQHTEMYYTLESSNYLVSNSVSDYMRKVEMRFAEEVKRVDQYLHSSTLDQLISCLNRVLIQKHQDAISQEVPSLLNNEKFDDLARMYSLLERIADGLNPLRSELEKHIQLEGCKAIESIASEAVKDPKIFVDQLLKVYKKYDDLVTNAFRNDITFIASLDKACRRFINDNAICRNNAKNSTRTPELLARYVDTMLKKNSKNPEDSEIESVLNDVMTIFKYIEEKDVFMHFYSKDLAYRLIQGTSASEDSESNMIGKLKSACGFEYTSKLQRMFTDITISRDINEGFLRHCEDTNIKLAVDFSIQVLSTGSWPLTPPSTNFSTPLILSECENLFLAYYSKKHTGRKIAWLHQYSKGELLNKSSFKSMVGKPQPYTFQCSTYQMGILLLFNSAQKLSYGDMLSSTQLSDTVLTSTLQSLLKARLLLIDPKLTPENPALTPKHRFMVNPGYKNQRVKVSIIQRAEPEANVNNTYNNINDDRNLQIQAAIVRVMKMRRELTHQNLLAEVLAQLQPRFQPRVNAIKKCIDILIEKEYLERVKDKKDLYHYLA